MKTTKGGKVMNPTDAYRKELRKKELKRNKKERKKVREVGIMKKDPESLREQIEKLEMMKADGALDKARKHKKRQLEDTLNLVLKKRKEYEEKMREKGETPVMFSHLGPVRRRTSAEEDRANHPDPEDSVYYHPTLNPTGAPPPGKPPMFKSSIGPRIPLSTASTSGDAGASSSDPVLEDDPSAVTLPPPPPPPPLPPQSESDAPASGDAPALGGSLPPLPPLPPQPPVAIMGAPLPPPPPGPPPPPPGPLPMGQVGGQALPPPPPLQQSSIQPPPLGIRDINLTDRPATADMSQVTGMRSLPPPPPPPGLAPKPATNQVEILSEKDAINAMEGIDVGHLVPPPPPPLRQQPSVPRPAGLGLPPGMMVPMLPRPPFGPPPGPPPMMRPPLPPGPPPPGPPPPGPPPAILEDNLLVLRPTVPPKPSYVKSAAPTVVKRPLAQHTPELTAMVPASVRVRRETAVMKPKQKTPVSIPTAPIRAAAPVVTKPEVVISSGPTPKVQQSVDDSYMAFLEDMKALGALDG
ncbi:hypothetical protein MLD38_031952 [Melastoma candidum]|uniref:Uncharacterized protein n=1 Tax=Melastoma candidum TaxID=119954 RepID=A0ACB9MRA2_9MYRT|nr:hypothetical protein MLD38_031952 [Melastoma candidum]